MREPLPLATVQNAVLEFLRGRDDAVVSGSQAVNAYTEEPRMSQDVDLLSTRAEELAEGLSSSLSQQFDVEVRVRRIGRGTRTKGTGGKPKPRRTRVDNQLKKKERSEPTANELMLEAWKKLYEARRERLL